MKNSVKMIVITGASSGIGEALAYEYAAQGHSLAITGRNGERLKNIVDKCKYLGAETVENKVIDVTDATAMKTWLKKIDEDHPVDIIIANAGISGGMDGLKKADLFKQASKIFETNITGVINTISPLYEKMVKRQRGHIVLMSSLASFSPWSGAPAYAASKATVRFLGEGMAASCQKYNIDVSVICPGFVESRMTDANDFPMPLKISAKKAAKKIVKGISRKRRIIVFPLTIYIIVRMVAFLPSSFISLLTSRMPAKKGL